MCSSKISVDKKLELTPDFSGVDPLHSAEVRQRWSQSGLPPKFRSKVQDKYGSGAGSRSRVDPHNQLR